MSVNNCHFIGNLTKDVESRFTPAGKQVVNFSIAVNEKFGGEESTLFVNVVAWQKLAEICEKYLSKGKKVYIQGRMQVRSYDNRDGVKVYVTEIIANNMEMLSGRDDIQRQNNNQKSQGQQGYNPNSSGSAPPHGNSSTTGGGGFQEPVFNPDDHIPF